MTTLTLPWPSRALSPNARGHWSKRHTAAKAAKHNAWGIALAAGVKPSKATSVQITYTFHPPRAGRFDLDNALASMKPSTDGISMALGIDDSLFDFTVLRGEPARPDGCVAVRIELEGEEVAASPARKNPPARKTLEG